MTKNPFLSYTQAISNTYSSTAVGLAEDMLELRKPPKRKMHRNINSLLQESFFLGATKFGDNFIA